jgi:C4-dicarboxylate-specific signal transduction histidine kinase
MVRAPNELETYATHRLLLWRIRIIMLICAAGGVIFGGKELLLTGQTSPQFWTQMLGITLSTSTFLVLRHPWFVPRAWPVSVFVISFTYFLTALAGMLSPTREYATTVVLFIGAAATTATIVPWGVWGQLPTVLVGVITLGVAVYVTGGTASVLMTDPGVATMIAFGWSVAAAYEIDRFRTAHRSELLRRRRGERAILRLNARLEQRVAERTAQLHDANAALMREAAERAVVQQELRQHQDELAHVLRLNTITELAAGLAHEINQPLGAISNFAGGSVQRLRQEATTPRELLDVMQRIGEEAVRAGEILRGLRTLVQPSSQTVESIDVNTLAGEAVRVLDWRARLPRVTVRLERAPEVRPVHAHAVQIEQVILNLILNGIEAIERTAAGRGEIVVSTNPRDGGVEVAVSDTGGGVPADVAAKLFTPFFTTKNGGLGLGLAISRSIIERHGGRLWMTSNATAAGSTFHFWLPATNATPAKEVA